jgi:hypothetical protein
MRQNRRLFSAYFVLTLSLSAAGLATLAGCGDGKIARYPVTGTVIVDGQAAEGAMVLFCPVEGSDEFMKERPIAWTDASGKYELRTFEPGDGAPAGQYKVMVRWMAKASQAPQDPDRGGGGSFDRLRNRYTNPEMSGLTATVNEEATEVPPFELKTK